MVGGGRTFRGVGVGKVFGYLLGGGGGGGSEIRKWRRSSIFRYMRGGGQNSVFIKTNASDSGGAYPPIPRPPITLTFSVPIFSDLEKT